MAVILSYSRPEGKGALSPTTKSTLRRDIFSFNLPVIKINKKT